MPAKRSQTDSELPAKVYQLDAVESKVDQALLLLDTVVKNTSGLVSESQLSAVKKEIETDTDEKIKASEKAIHLEYRPFKKAAYWLAAIVVAGLVGQYIALMTGLFTGGK
jgi:hypothetical protein